MMRVFISAGLAAVIFGCSKPNATVGKSPATGNSTVEKTSLAKNMGGNLKGSVVTIKPTEATQKVPVRVEAEVIRNLSGLAPAMQIEFVSTMQFMQRMIRERPEVRESIPASDIEALNTFCERVEFNLRPESLAEFSELVTALHYHTDAEEQVLLGARLVVLVHESMDPPNFGSIPERLSNLKTALRSDSLTKRDKIIAFVKFFVSRFSGILGFSEILGATGPGTGESAESLNLLRSDGLRRIARIFSGSDEIEFEFGDDTYYRALSTFSSLLARLELMASGAENAELALIQIDLVTLTFEMTGFLVNDESSRIALGNLRTELNRVRNGETVDETLRRIRPVVEALFASLPATIQMSRFGIRF